VVGEWSVVSEWSVRVNDWSSVLWNQCTHP